MAFGQNLIIGSGSTYGGSGGTYIIKGSIRSAVASPTVTINGTVTLGNTSATASDTIGTGATGGLITFGTLNVVNPVTKPTTAAISTKVGTSLSIAASAGLDIQGTSLTIDAASSIGSGGSLVATNTSSKVYYDGSAQTVLNTTYNDLELSSSSSTTTTISGGTTLVNGVLNANANSNLSIGTGGTLNFAAAANANLAADFTDNGTFTAPTTGTVTLNGAAQAIGGSATPTFNILTIGGTGTKTANTNINVAGQLAVNQPITMSGSNVLTMQTGAPTPTFTGQTEITGSMTWQAYAAQAYTFNNASTIVTFKSADAGNSRTFTLNSQPTTYPNAVAGNPYTVGHTVKRSYTAAYSNWGSAATDSLDLQLAYTQAEGSTTGVSENKLNDFQNVGVNGIQRSSKITGKPVRQASGATAFGTVQLYGLTSALLTPNASNALALDDRFTIYKSIASTGIWGSAGTWDAGSVPTYQDEVEITAAQAVTVADTYTAAAYKVTVDASSSLTVGGGASGILNVGAGGLVNNATGTGLTLASGAQVNITSGNLTNNGAITNAGAITVQ
ncbi:MAG TPA: hypothetical protein VMU30_07055 [Bacteroidota bacterium]|nr:hypothetical protein [Bacteroidota bacterium]